MPQIMAPAWAEDDGELEGEDHKIEGLFEDEHETPADLMILLATAHVGGVMFAAIRHRENLARAMITADKRAPEPADIAWPAFLTAGPRGPTGPAALAQGLLLADVKLKQKAGRRQELLRSEAQPGSIISKETEA